MENDGEIFSAPTIVALATAIGADPAVLVQTVEGYNRAAESGRSDSLSVTRTGKPKVLREPFYGLKVIPGVTFTMGGILINGRGEALNLEEEPIPGLYAAGDAIGGLMGGYRGGYTGGLMQAVVTGILAGENAVRP
jgi:fumarate reductase flavoprotein subunit